jgi:transposase
VSLYRHPPDETRVICVDELGPLGAKVYPGRQWCPAGQPPGYAPNYGKRGAWWVFGAFEPASGLALTDCQSKRRRGEFIAFLDRVVATWTDGELILIMDNLAVHKTLEVRLWALAQPRVRFLFQPRYAPWLNLIEPWWKTLKNLALKGRNFDSLDAVKSAIEQATNYWNAHRHPYRWRRAA